MPLLEGLSHSPGFLVFAVLLLGLCVGSFLNVVAHRLPLMMQRGWQRECRELLELPAGPETAPLSLLRPASRCPGCGTPIKPWHNIPVVSWLWLRGRCAACKAAISVQYPLLEAACGVLSAVCAWRFGWSAELAAALLMTWALLVLTVIDLRTQLLPDSITLPLLWLGLLLSIPRLFTTPTAAITGAAAGYLSLWLFYQVHHLLTGKEGMGFGDFKLFAALGAWFGWIALVPALLLAAVPGSLVGIALLLRGQHRDVHIPFGPYLAFAGWMMLVFGDRILGAWFRLQG